MNITLPRLAIRLALLAVVSASTVLGQEEIKFEPLPERPFGEAVISSDSPSSDSPSNQKTDGGNPFIPEDAAPRSGSEVQQTIPMSDPSVPMAMPGRPAARGLFTSGLFTTGRLWSGKHGCPGTDCDECSRFGAELFSGVESWRNVGSSLFSLPLQSSTGVVTGGNLGMPIPRLREYGIGFQLGGSLGLYNFDGRPPFNNQETDVQQQVFITAGFFRRAREGSPFSAGLVYDWQANDAYGALATHPFLGQWRAQVGYALNCSEEIGVWGTFRDRRDSQEVDLGEPFGVVTSYTRPVSQVNLFWHHNFESGADSWLWLGVPEHEKVAGEGRLGEYTLGAMLHVPLTERMAVYANGEYMRPAAHTGQMASAEAAYTIGFGLVFHPRATSRNRSVAGQCWSPYLPVANNSNFLVDSGF